LSLARLVDTIKGDDLVLFTEFDDATVSEPSRFLWASTVRTSFLDSLRPFTD
jgi:hypothetical protein